MYLNEKTLKVRDGCIAKLSTESTDASSFISDCGIFTIRAAGEVVLGYRCKFYVAAFRNYLFDHFAVAFPPQLENAVARRCSDYLAGRVCARRLLTLLGFKVVPSDLPIGANREPIWPTGVLGSISHSTDSAVCIATTRSEVIGIGIDTEKMIPDIIAAEIRQQVVSSEEEIIIRSQFRAFNEGLTAVFSAKESIYKAAHHLVGRVFDFSAVRLVYIDSNRMVFSVVEQFGECFDAAVRVEYKLTNGEIMTVCRLIGPSSDRRSSGFKLSSSPNFRTIRAVAQNDRRLTLS